MADVYTLTIKPIADLGDIKANVGTIQNYFDKLKMPKFSNQIREEAAKIEKEYDKINKKQIEGVKTVADKNQIEKSQNIILHSWNEILEVIKQVDGTEIDIDFNKFTSKVKEAQDEVERLGKQLNEELKKGNVSGIKNLLTGSGGTLQTDSGSINVGALSKTTSSKKLRTYASDMEAALNANQITKFLQIYKEAKQYVDSNPMFGDKTKQSMDAMGQAVDKLKDSVSSQTINAYEAAQTKVFEEQKIAVDGVTGSLHNVAQAADEYNQQGQKVADNNLKIAESGVELGKAAQTIERQVESYFGLNAIFRTVANMAREAMNTVKELDAAMTETAVVTNFKVSDMWDKLPIYTAQANQLGSTIKDVYEATTLYYQQGLNTSQAMGLANETLKMARITGMDAKDATDAMTAALRGFNLELNQVSAQRINDVYSELAAITASDTQEISTAMEKVASLAHSAGMEVETTSAFLAQMIETTREAPENLGTALKTVVARFQEMKQDPTKLIDSEGVMLDANKVDKALKSIGVNLLNTNGEFRKLDDVFLEIASKWDTLSMGQQRYIATMAAGSRQQSRFIAMMSNYSRTMELVDAAYDASGASQKQFEKTLDSMEAKLNKLKNAWDQFTMGLMNNEILKFVVDAGTEFLTVVNKIIDSLASITGPAKGVTKSILTLLATFGGLTAARGILKSGIGAGVQWFGGEKAKAKWNEALDIVPKPKEYRILGQQNGQAYTNAFMAQLRRVNGNDLKQYLAIQRGELNFIPTDNLTESIIQGIKNQGAGISRGIEESIREQLKGGNLKQVLSDWNLSIDDYLPKIEGLNTVSGQFTTTITQMGSSMQAFGAILQGTPLAPFGIVVSKLGTAFLGLSKILTVTKGQILANGVAAETSAVGFSALGIKVKALGSAIKAFGIALKGLIVANPIILAIVAAIAAVGVVVGLVIKDITKYDRQLKDSKEVATQAADAYDALKQSMTDLDNAINNLNENKNSFDGLVAGTDAFNEKLIENNKLVADLLDKYDILGSYINTSETGIMTIDEEGIKAVRKEQQKLMAQASAISILSDADVNRQELQKEQRELFDSWTGNELAQKYAEGGVHASEYNALQKEIDTNMQAATNAAINTLLATQQLQNEGTAKILQSNYDKYEAAAKKMAEEASKEEKRDAYAKTYGYTREGKKYYDQDGNEVENLDDDTVLDSYVQIKIAEQLDIDASKVDKALTGVSKNLSGIMGESFQDTNTFLADIVSRNADTNHELLKKLTDNPQMLADLVQEMTDEQVAALLGQDVEVVSAQSDRFKKELIDEIIEDTQEIARTQAATSGELSVRLARARGKTVQDFSPTTGDGRRYGSAQGNSNKLVSRNSAAFKEIEKDISKLTYQQQASINKIVTSLEQNVGPEAMSAFLTNAIDAYNLNEGQYAEQLDAIFANADFSSALGRAEVYDQLENNHFGKNGALVEEIAQIGKATKKASKDANVLGDAFLEVYSSADFTEVLKDLDKFKNEAGKIDANGIREMAKQSSSLARYLDLNKVSAEGFAHLLEGFNATGISAIDEGVLELLNSFNRLDNLVQETHEHINNFKGDIDTGEAEDFAIENYKKISEYWGNGEYGNLDLHARIQEVVGIDNWIAALEANNGNFQDTINQFIPLLKQSEEGLYQNWVNIANGISGYGKDLSDSIAQANSSIGKNISVGWASNGGIDLQTNGATTEEVIQWLQAVYGVSENYAKMMLEDFQNYSADLYQELQLNDWNAGLLDFADTHTFNDQIVVASDQLQLLAASTGKSTEQLITDLNALDGRVATAFDITEEGLAGFANIFNGQSLQEWLGYNQDRDGNGQADQIYDITNAVSDMQSKGIDLANAQQALFDGIQDQTEVLYNGQQIQVDSLKSAEDLANKMEELNSLAEWDPVLEAFTNEATTFGTEAARAFKASIPTANVPPASGRGGIPGHTGKTVDLPEDTNTDYTLTLKKDSQWDATLNTTKHDIITLNEEYDKVQKQRTLNLNSGAVTTATTRLTNLGTSLDTLSGKTATVHVDVVENKVGHGATGINNYISSTGFYTGSAAKGTKGKLGPNGKGGMTLTGEEGYEIAWIPSENRSMIVGASGPQMIDLPGDTVVYNHEQSKRIIKQKGINLGSSATGYNGRGGSGGSKGSGSGSGSSSSSSSSDKEKDPKHSNWYKEEVRRFNLNQSINQLTEKIEKITKSISDTLAKLGVKYSDISKDVEKQTQLLHQTIAQQQQLRDSYKAELEWLANGNRQLWVSLTNASNESEEISVGTSQFISGNADTGYSVSYDAIVKYLQANGYGGENLTANAESLFNLLNQQISNLQSSFNAAAKAIEDAQQKLKDLVNQIREAFYGWENELTRVYDLSKQLELNEAMNGRFTSEIGLLLSSVSTQFEDMATILGHLNDAQQGSIELTKQRLELLYAMIQARHDEIEALMDGGAAEKERYEAIKAENEAALKNGQALTAEMLAREAAAYDEYARAAWGQLYVTSTQNADGSYTFDFNEEQLEADRLAGKISEDTYNAIKDGFDNLVEGQIDYHEAISEVQDYLKELGEQLDDYYKTMADLENDLIDAFVDAAQKEVSKLESLNSSLTSAAKSVLEQVKKSIDARRKAEDNAKTEADIARKQERLSILRANTSGGNQVEIAQLEKEIGDAQRSYGRTLEDQMLAQMQTQADEASKQRQQQIDLAKQQIEYNKQAGVYAAMADELLDDIKANATQIALLLDETKELGRGKWEQLIDKNEIERQIIEAGNASAAIPYLEEAISQQQDLYDALIQLDQDMMEVVGTTIGQGQNNPNTPGIYNATNGGIPTTGSTGSGSSGGSSSGSGTANSTPKAKDYSSGWLATLPETNSNYFSSAQVQTLQHGLNTMKWSGLISFGADLAIDGIIGPKTTAAIKALQKLVGTTQDGIWGPNTGKATHKKFPQYARGGLNKTTGPAWLDGTRAKPELVLNAQDTKNFIALKDILSGVMRTISHTDTSNIYNSPTEFNINVNVEKIASDYDVDRLAARIKRDIVKDATYRNVTTVRNFR